MSEKKMRAAVPDEFPEFRATRRFWKALCKSPLTPTQQRRVVTMLLEKLDELRTEPPDGGYA